MLFMSQINEYHQERVFLPWLMQKLQSRLELDLNGGDHIFPSYIVNAETPVTVEAGTLKMSHWQPILPS